MQPTNHEHMTNRLLKYRTKILKTDEDTAENNPTWLWYLNRVQLFSIERGRSNKILRATEQRVGARKQDLIL